ncbi:MAG: hypothetical protein QNJ81_13100 [Acidimicrobiia bacterium]|nr:hypothetical protein [Acidimicrobiia bacterium]
MRRLSLLLVVLSVFMVTFAPAAVAEPPHGVKITAEIDIATVTGDFTATGDAVANGLLCPAGEAAGVYVGDINEGRRFTTFTIDYTLTCDDLSGAAYLRLKVWLNPDTGRTFALWRATGGDGDYAGLRGGGWLIGTPTVPGEIEDAYTGWLRF